MTITLKTPRRTIRKASIGETNSFTEEFELQTDGISTIKDCLDLAIIPQSGVYYPSDPRYRCKNVDLSEVVPVNGGGYVVTVTITWETKLPKDSKDREGNPINEDTPPWLMPIEDFTNGSSPVEETINHVYVPDDNNVGEYKRVPFRNTAGTPLTGIKNRYLYTFGFAYNVEEMSSAFAFRYNGRVNADTVRVVGYDFEPMQLQIVQIAATPQTDYNEDGSVRWRYKKVSVQFQADPLTFNRDYANVGLFVKRGSTEEGTYPARLWQGVAAKETLNASEGDLWFGTRDEIMDEVNDGNISYDSVEAVSEPMFLTRDGWDVSPIDPDTELQTPTYNTGCPDEPIDFGPLGLPEEEP